MALRSIRLQGDPVLEKKCKEVKEITPKIEELIDDMPVLRELDEKTKYQAVSFLIYAHAVRELIDEDIAKSLMDYSNSKVWG